MKKFSLLLLAGILLLPGYLGAETFEGKIAMKMITPNAKADDGNMVIVLSLKEGFYRTDMEAANKDQQAVLGGMIMDLKKQEMIILMPAQKRYMVRAIPQPEAGKESDKTKIDSTNDFTIERTGEKKQILGYTCEKVLVKSKDMDSEIWATDQLGTYMGSGASGGAGAKGGMFGGSRSNNARTQEWEKAFQGKDFFPLLVITLDKKGKEVMRMETISVDKKKLAESDFAVPAGYEKFDVGSMMKGMIPGFGK